MEIFRGLLETALSWLRTKSPQTFIVLLVVFGAAFGFFEYGADYGLLDPEGWTQEIGKWVAFVLSGFTTIAVGGTKE